jgi:hypothetical protein
LVLVGFVDRGDLVVPDADRFVHHLDHRREAVGRAGGRRQEPVPGRVIDLVVYADHNIQGRGVLDRGSHDDAADAFMEITLQLIRLQEFPGGFQHDLGTEIVLRHFGRRARRSAIANEDGAIIRDFEGLAPAAMQAIELEEMSGRRGSATYNRTDLRQYAPR